MWGLEGLWVPECYYPWGHTDDIVLKDDGRDLTWLWHRRDPAKIPYGMFELYNNHTGLIFTSGPEICHHFLTFFRYSGDQEFLRHQAYPFIRDVCEFMANILRQEVDGLYHLDPANALETWWKVRDPADTLDAIHYLFPEFIRLSERYGLDATLRSRCQSILAALPEPSIGKWHDDGRVDGSVDAYAPAAGKHDHPRRVNAENPALYRVYPFGLSGIGTPDFDRAQRTFACRTSPLWFGWSMDAIWAARLGLRDEACSLLVEHARRFNVFPYGGWHFNAHACHDKPFPHNRDLYTKPFLDAGGCSATALQEILLQSHGGTIRIVPALSGKWSGIFQLRAENGFLVAADIHQGRPQFVEIRSLFGQRCVIANPWSQSCRVRSKGDVLLETTAEEISFDTEVGAVYTLEPTDQPVASIPACSIEQREAFCALAAIGTAGFPVGMGSPRHLLVPLSDPRGMNSDKVGWRHPGESVAHPLRHPGAGHSESAEALLSCRPIISPSLGRVKTDREITAAGSRNQTPWMCHRDALGRSALSDKQCHASCCSYIDRLIRPGLRSTNAARYSDGQSARIGPSTEPISQRQPAQTNPTFHLPKTGPAKRSTQGTDIATVTK